VMDPDLNQKGRVFFLNLMALDINHPKDNAKLSIYVTYPIMAVAVTKLLQSETHPVLPHALTGCSLHRQYETIYNPWP
jgi:hypothetical protein